jgi:uncharacterized protein YecT (DUF1311 family)
MVKLFLSVASIMFGILVYGQTQAEMNGEARKNFLKTEKELNTVYNKILKEYKTDTAFIKNLKTAQKLWLKLRHAEMDVKYPDSQTRLYGSVLPMCWSIYMEELTNDRIKQLRVWLSGIEEGNVCAGSVKVKE